MPPQPIAAATSIHSLERYGNVQRHNVVVIVAVGCGGRPRSRPVIVVLTVAVATGVLVVAWAWRAGVGGGAGGASILPVSNRSPPSHTLDSQSSSILAAFG